MTETDTSSAPPKRTKHVNTQATSRSLRHLAREAAERGERLVDIARRLRIAGSTLNHWAKEDGFRRKDVKARASLAHGPRFPGKADYPELKEMGPRARLERMDELAGEARLRAVAAIEDGFLDYGLKWLREAQKLARGRDVLKEYLADYPPPEEEEEASWQDKALWELEEMALARQEGREPEFPWQEPKTAAEEAEEDLIWETARARRPALPDDAHPELRISEEMEVLQDVMRLKREVKKWRLLPGRGDPPFLRAVDRGRSEEEEPQAPAGKKLYGMDDAFPVRFPVRRE